MKDQQTERSPIDGHTSLSSAKLPDARPRPGREAMPTSRGVRPGGSGRRGEEDVLLGKHEARTPEQSAGPGRPGGRATHTHGAPGATQKSRSAPARRPYATGLAPEPSRIWLCALRRGCAATKLVRWLLPAAQRGLVADGSPAADWIAKEPLGEALVGRPPQSDKFGFRHASAPAASRSSMEVAAGTRWWLQQLLL